MVLIYDRSTFHKTNIDNIQLQNKGSSSAKHFQKLLHSYEKNPSPKKKNIYSIWFDRA